MEVTLKQRDIEAALKLYLIKEGIQIAGKSVDMSFVSGRKNTGLSVSISITDSGIPDHVLADGPKLAVVNGNDQEESGYSDPAPDPSPEPEPTTKTSSLFN